MTPQVVYADAPASKTGSRPFGVEHFTQPTSGCNCRCSVVRCAVLDTPRTMTSREGFLSSRIAREYSTIELNIQVGAPDIPRPQGQGFTALFDKHPNDLSNSYIGVQGEEGSIMSTETNKTIVQRFLSEVWDSRGNLDAIEELTASDYIPHSVLPHLPQNREGDKQFAAMYRTAFPDIQATIEKMVAEDDYVSVHFTGRATHLGEFAGVPATGRSVTISGIGLYRLRDQKIVEAWVFSDQMGLMQQLGAMPGQR